MNRMGRAMADPTRSRILLLLLDGPSYPAIISRDLELSRSNVSNHLACLRDCGIVVAELEGRRTRYQIADPHLARALSALLETTLAVDEGAQCIDPSCPIGNCATGGARRAHRLLLNNAELSYIAAYGSSLGSRSPTTSSKPSSLSLPVLRPRPEP